MTDNGRGEGDPTRDGQGVPPTDFVRGWAAGLTNAIAAGWFRAPDGRDYFVLGADFLKRVGCVDFDEVKHRATECPVCGRMLDIDGPHQCGPCRSKLYAPQETRFEDLTITDPPAMKLAAGRRSARRITTMLNAAFGPPRRARR